MALSDEQVVELIVATLASYQYSLDKAWELRDALLDAGACDPSAVAAMDVATLGNLLKSAGYDRGGITYIIAPRVQSLLAAVASGNLDTIEDCLMEKDREAFVRALCAVNGFGPTAAGIAWDLMATACSASGNR